MQSAIKKIVWFSILAIPFLAFYVADGKTLDLLNWGTSGFFFPFITGKNLVFRFLVEIAFAGWVVLALHDPSYRISIRKSPLTIAACLFIAILFVADIFGVDPTQSMWSNFERMEGFVGLLHVFLYFFVLTAMVRTLEGFQRMFKYFLAANLLVLAWSYGQLLGAKGYIFSKVFPEMSAWFSSRFPIHQSENRLDATIGNAAYFALFCLISAFIAALLWSQANNMKRAWGYPLIILLNLIALFYSGTRGTIIGLVVGVLFTLGIIAWHERGHARKVLATALGGVVLAVVLLFAFRNSDFIKSTPTLNRLASISITDLTTMSRVSIWNISTEAVLERPLLGYGQDNFSYIYARKFIPEKMWNLEPWYDRSHNVFFDWMVAAGILGLLSYLSLYAVALWLMWRKPHNMPFRERAILTGALAAYFVHNVFVFDNLTSYILFFALLAYIVMRTNGSHDVHGKTGVSNEHIKLIWGPVVLIALLLVQYHVNYRPYLVNTTLIQAMSIGQHVERMSVADAINLSRDSFVKAIALDTLGSKEAREQFLMMGVRMAQLQIPDTVTPAEKEAIAKAASDFVRAVRQDIENSYEDYKEDVRMLSIYGMFYVGMADAVSAEKVLAQAHALAPHKQLISFDIIRAYLMQQKYTEAYALAKETFDKAPMYPDAQRWFMLTSVYAKDLRNARAHMGTVGYPSPFDGDVLNALVSTGQTALAIEILNELKKTNPEMAPQIDAYLKTLPR